MRIASPRARRLALLLVALTAACASAPRREPPPPDRDRTDDPEFAAAARDAARSRDFPSQADALAAGVYEPFVHPDSVRPAQGAVAAAEPEARWEPPVTDPAMGAEDPSTEELLGTLDPLEPYNQGADSRVWTLQAGAFDDETGAFVRLRQLARDFPDLPRWHTADAGRFLVFVGRFADRGSAEEVRTRAVERGYADAWVRVAP